MDDLGNSYLTGDFWGMAIFGTGEPNETTLTGDYDIFVAKYDTKGNLRWARSAGGPYGGGSGIGIAVDNTGNSYVTGKYGGAVTFGAGEPNETTFSGPIVANLSDIFIAKYNVNGNLHWARSAGGPISASIGADIAVDDSGNSYITGSTYGSVTFGAGEPNEITFNTGNDGYHIFVARYDTDGNLGWVRNAGGLNNCNCPNNDGSVGIAIDDAGNNYITGFFDGSATFGAGEPNETTLTSKGIEDAFIAKYNADGNLGWVRSAGGHDPLIFSVSGGSDIDVDDAGNCYITGSFSGGSVTFGADEPNETTLTDSGGFFVAKYNRDGKLHWVINADAFSSKSIAVDDNGNSYITGDFRGPATFGAGEPNETILTGDSTSIFVAKYKGTLSEAIEDE